ncbi:MAG: hypothetical protein ACKVP7_26485 [Hyphomicrobiaceae bacterium]
MTHPIPEIRSDWEAAGAKLAAVLLVGSSAGLGALYAWSTGIRHGVALGCLSVAMAVALDMAKPLALSGALAAGWRRPARAAALGLLAIAAITYSLTAALTLLGIARGDGLAERADAGQKAADV